MTARPSDYNLEEPVEHNSFWIQKGVKKNNPNDLVWLVSLDTRASDETRTVFLDIAKQIQSASFENVAPVLATGSDGGIKNAGYVLIRRLEQTLADVLANRDPDTPLTGDLKQETLWICQTVCDALRGLANLHELGVVLGDLDPMSIEVSADLQTVNVACIPTVPLDNDRTMRWDAAYCAPELLEDNGVVDARVDVYSMGMVGYAALVGMEDFKPAFLKDDASDKEAAAWNNWHRSPTRHPPDLTNYRREVFGIDRIQTSLEQMVSKGTGARHLTAQDALVDLEDMLAQLGWKNTAPGEAEIENMFDDAIDGSGHPESWFARNKILVSAGAVALLLSAGLGYWTMVAKPAAASMCALAEDNLASLAKAGVGSTKGRAGLNDGRVAMEGMNFLGAQGHCKAANDAIRDSARRADGDIQKQATTAANLADVAREQAVGLGVERQPEPVESFVAGMADFDAANAAVAAAKDVPRSLDNFSKSYLLFKQAGEDYGNSETSFVEATAYLSDKMKAVQEAQAKATAALKAAREIKAEALPDFEAASESYTAGETALRDDLYDEAKLLFLSSVTRYEAVTAAQQQLGETAREARNAALAEEARASGIGAADMPAYQNAQLELKGANAAWNAASFQAATQQYEGAREGFARAANQREAERQLADEKRTSAQLKRDMAIALNGIRMQPFKNAEEALETAGDAIEALDFPAGFEAFDEAQAGFDTVVTARQALLDGMLASRRSAEEARAIAQQNPAAYTLDFFAEGVAAFAEGEEEQNDGAYADGAEAFEEAAQSFALAEEHGRAVTTWIEGLETLAARREAVDADTAAAVPNAAEIAGVLGAMAAVEEQWDEAKPEDADAEPVLSSILETYVAQCGWGSAVHPLDEDAVGDARDGIGAIKALFGAAVGLGEALCQGEIVCGTGYAKIPKGTYTLSGGDELAFAQGLGVGLISKTIAVENPFCIAEKQITLDEFRMYLSSSATAADPFQLTNWPRSETPDGSAEYINLDNANRYAEWLDGTLDVTVSVPNMAQWVAAFIHLQESGSSPDVLRSMADSMREWSLGDCRPDMNGMQASIMGREPGTNALARCVSTRSFRRNVGIRVVLTSQDDP